MDVKNEIFWSEIRSRFGELCSTPPPRISRSTPPPPYPAPGTAAQIALKLFSKNKKSASDKYIYLFIYFFVVLCHTNIYVTLVPNMPSFFEVRTDI